MSFVFLTAVLWGFMPPVSRITKLNRVLVDSLKAFSFLFSSNENRLCILNEAEIFFHCRLLSFFHHSRKTLNCHKSEN